MQPNEQYTNSEPQKTKNTDHQQPTLVVLAHLVWVIGVVVATLLAIRFLLILFAANSANGFVNFIYTISYPLARPFFGIFNYQIHYGVSRVEFASLVGIAIYSIVAYLITKVLTINHPQTI
jgi:uncharacterized protein YggT (Ycf19 family)